jgi:hypothetical protein
VQIPSCAVDKRGMLPEEGALSGQAFYHHAIKLAVIQYFLFVFVGRVRCDAHIYCSLMSIIVLDCHEQLLKLFEHTVLAPQR